MALARVTYTGDAVETDFTLPFPYIAKAYVEVYLDGVLQTLTTHYTWLTDSTIQFVTAPPSGEAVLFCRNTPKATKLVDFVGAAVLSESNLDLNADQLFHIQQELLDQASGVATVEELEDGVDFTAGTTTQLTLAAGKGIGESTLLITFDGVVVHQDTFSLAGAIITFDAAIPAGTSNVRISYAVPIGGGLNDNSVTTSKIANLAVTEPKLAQAVFNDLTLVVVDPLDHVVIADESDSGNKKKVIATDLIGQVPDATDAIKGKAELSTITEIITGTDDTRIVTPAGLRGGMRVYSSAVDVSDGSPTEIDFTGIPEWATQITISFLEMSWSGSSNPLIQIGDAGGIEITGYVGGGSTLSSVVATTSYTTGFGIRSASGGNQLNGCIVLTKFGGGLFRWTAFGVTGNVSGTNATYTTQGTKVLTAALDRVRITTLGGTQTGDNGWVSIAWN